MQILSLHYTNVGPFRDQTVQVSPRAGSYLIQAPIGSGKSMIFFDGPLFALYKKKSRPILNTSSESGELMIEFMQDGQQYCILRQLKKTPTSESVKSKMWIKSFKGFHTREEILSIGKPKEIDISSDYQAVEFKNETDLQELINEILPPQEVLLATFFLMQESDNVFELPPQERLEVFKNIFGLLDIDEMKERVAGRKRELSALIKVHSDMSNEEKKFIQGLEGLLQSAQDFDTLIQEYELDQLYTDRHDFIKDYKLLEGKLLLEHFQLPHLPEKEVFQQKFTQSLEYYHQTQTQVKLLTQSQESLQTQENSLHSKVRGIETDITNSLQKLDKLDNKKLKETVEKIKNLEELQAKLRTPQDQERLQQKLKQFLIKLPQDTTNKEFLEQNFEKSWTLYETRDLIQNLRELGKEYHHRQELFLEKQKSYRLQEKKLQEDILATQKSIKNFQESTSEQEKTLREKLKDCPCAKDILEDKSLQSTEDYLKALEEAYQKATQALAEFQKQYKISSQEDTAQATSSIRKILEDLGWKNILERAKNSQEFQERLEQERKIRESLEKDIETKTKLEEVLSSLQKQKKSYLEELKVLEAQKKNQEEKMQILNKKTQSQKTKEKIFEEQKMVEKFYDYYKSLKNILSDYKEKLLTIKKTKEQEEIMKELYTIFSKELLLLVVQANLPKIQNLMNAYLAQVVDYTLEMEIDSKTLRSDKIELLVTIHDELGKREVESLSGGQKVVLKLVWMIAISFIMDAPMLFLDETINNMDSDTVSKVAEILTSFTKQKGKEFQFFVVSHDQQIQSLGIRDNIIEITR